MKDSDQRFTPEHVLNRVRDMYAADVWIDPCTHFGNPAGATHWCTPSGTFGASTAASNGQDGLTCNWVRFAFHAYVNPPYSRGELARWMTKCVVEANEKGVEVIALIPSDLGSKAGALAASTCDALCFVKGRLAFGSPAGQLVQGAKQPSVLVYWGDRSKRFQRIFSTLGVVWVR